MRTGDEYLEQIRDGRKVFLGAEVVEDVTTHPAFRNATRSMARLYDITSDPANRDALTYVEPETGEHCNSIFLRPRDADDLRRRRAVHEAWAGGTFGLMGRSPDHVAAFVTGMACQPEVVAVEDRPFDINLTNYWRYLRDNDLFAAYAVVPPAGAKGTEAVMVQSKGYAAEKPTAGLRVIDERDNGVVVRGFKILATGAALADEVFVGSVLPLGPGEEPFSVTFGLPVATPGLKMISRKSFELNSVSTVDEPLASRFDETDSVLFFDDVLVPWERVFVLNDLQRSRDIFYSTPAHTLGNAQAHIRLLAKLRLILGVVRRVADANGIAQIPAVRDQLAALAVRVAVVEGLILGQESRPALNDNGFVCQDRQTMYATMSWTCEEFPRFVESCRELLGSSPFQMPASASALDEGEARDIFARFTLLMEGDELEQRYKLMKLAWDLIGSEFASRHLQYEMFYAGPKHVTRGRASHYFGWDVALASADRCLREFGREGIASGAGASG
jgi:4-hydroxyphenylacetate 3-monooxygenase